MKYPKSPVRGLTLAQAQGGRARLMQAQTTSSPTVTVRPAGAGYQAHCTTDDGVLWAETVAELDAFVTAHTH